jgi:hypothetical protein
MVGREDYVHWRASVLENLTSVKLTTYERNGREYIRTSTKSHPKYTKAYNRMYGTGRKSIDNHQLTFLDWEYLAIWYMDDGNCYVDKRVNATPKVKLATYGFSYYENVAIKRAIRDILGVDFSIIRETRKDRFQYYLKLPSKYYDKFRSGVETYIFPSFQYKIPVNTCTYTQQSV